MPIEDFTTYTEVDPGADITVDANTISWDDLDSRGTDSYVYYDKGAGFFDGDFSHTFLLLRGADIDTGASPFHWVLANDIDDYYSLIVDDKDAAGVKVYYGGASSGIYLTLLEAGEEAQDGWSGVGKPAADTVYYMTVDRNDDGGVNGTGRYICYICTGNYYGESGSSLQDTLQLDSSAGCQFDFRYVYGVNTVNTGSSYYSDGYTEDLDLHIGPIPVVMHHLRQQKIA
ncbi:MAG: hypothetical protein ACYSSL_01580 [Planctomycetota bacterium]|jgi:hypothetical protein